MPCDGFISNSAAIFTCRFKNFQLRVGKGFLVFIIQSFSIAYFLWRWGWFEYTIQFALHTYLSLFVSWRAKAERYSIKTEKRFSLSRNSSREREREKWKEESKQVPLLHWRTSCSAPKNLLPPLGFSVLSFRLPLRYCGINYQLYLCEIIECWANNIIKAWFFFILTRWYLHFCCSFGDHSFIEDVVLCWFRC